MKIKTTCLLWAIWASFLTACGSNNSAIELTLAELEKYSAFTAWVDVGKGWSE